MGFLFYFTILQFFAKLSSPETPFSLSESSVTRLLPLACLHPNHFSKYYLFRVVFFRVSVTSVPSAEAFVGPNSPVLEYLRFLLPFIEPAVDRLRLSVTHLLIQRGYPCISRSLFPKLIYLMGHDNELDSDGLGHSYPAIWKADLTSADEPRIRRDCFIPQTVNLRFDSEWAGGWFVPTRTKSACTRLCSEQASGYPSQGWFRSC